MLFPCATNFVHLPVKSQVDNALEEKPACILNHILAEAFVLQVKGAA